MNGQSFSVVYSYKNIYSEDYLLSRPYVLDKEIEYRYSLNISGNKSLFTADSLVYLKNNTSDFTNMFIKNTVYKDYKSDTWIQIRGDYIDGYGYGRKISDLKSKNEFSWKRTGKVKEVLGMRCIEVVFKTKTACYTQEISIPDGPNYGVFGLPGLVLEYTDQTGYWLAKKINFVNSEMIVMPSIKISDNERRLKIPLSDLQDQPTDKVIITTQDTPTHKWLKFHLH